MVKDYLTGLQSCNYPVDISRPGKPDTCSVGQEQHSQGHIHEVDEAGLCGSSLLTGPRALPALGGSQPGQKYYTTDGI